MSVYTPTNPLEAVVSFLVAGLTGVDVRPADDEGLPAQGDLGATIVVGLAGGQRELAIPVVQQRATFVMYGPDPLAVYQALCALAFNATTRTPYGPRAIGARWWLRRFTLGAAVGPLLEPGTLRQRVDCSAVLVLHSFEN